MKHLIHAHGAKLSKQILNLWNQYDQEQNKSHICITYIYHFVSHALFYHQLIPVKKNYNIFSRVITCPLSKYKFELDIVVTVHFYYWFEC